MALSGKQLLHGNIARVQLNNNIPFHNMSSSRPQDDATDFNECSLFQSIQ